MNSHEVKAGPISESLIVPGSKSYINRALICAALKKEKVLIENINFCEDVTYLIEALKLIGLNLFQTESSITILNSFPDCEKDINKEISLTIGDGGTTLRFLLPLLSLGKKTYKLILSEQLMGRPHDDLLMALSSLGAIISKEKNIISIKGSITKESVKVDAKLSSQFASGLYLLKLIKPNLKIEVNNLKHSQTYFEMTKEVVSHFKTENTFTIPADLSSAAFPIVFSCVKKQKVFIKNLKKDPYQADSKIFEILDQIKCNYSLKSDGVEFTHNKENYAGFTQDISDCLDLAPILSVLASFCVGESKLINVKALIHKESDRLKGIMNLLKHFDIKSRLENDSLIIIGKSDAFTYKKSLEVSFDHRMVMAGAIFLKALEGGRINNAKAVKKSFPKFFLELNI